MKNDLLAKSKQTVGNDLYVTTMDDVNDVGDAMGRNLF